jgi:hypothetical protein
MSASCNFKFLSDKKTFIAEYSGEVGIKVLIEICESLFAHPEYSPEMNGIFDFRQCELNIDFNDSFAFVQYLVENEQRAKGLCAIVTQSASNYGTTRIYAELAADLQDEIRHFETVEEALEWVQKTTQAKTNTPETGR